jgi:hypothetical protein
MLDGFGDGLDGVGVARTGGGKTGFDDIDAELFQLARDAQFLVLGHRCARALLAIAQGGVKIYKRSFMAGSMACRHLADAL